MGILHVENLAKSFGERFLFENVSFDVFEKDRIGFIGANGTGKSTLLSIIQGKEGYDRGIVSIPKGVRLGTLEQALPDGEHTLYEITLEVFRPLMDIEMSLDSIHMEIEAGNHSAELLDKQFKLRERFEFLGGLTYRSRTRAALLGLGFSEQEMSKSVARLSGGEIRKALLARLLLSDSNFLILDEPTNHLDLSAIAWLENYLLGYRGAFIVVSHDRYFLDKITNRTMELRNGSLHIKNGNYSTYQNLASDEKENIEREYNKKIREIRRLNGIIEQQRRWNQAHNYVTIASKEKQIERIRSTLVKPEKDPAQIRFRFEAPEPPGNEIVRAQSLSKSFGEKHLFSDVSFLIRKGEHVCLLGANGCGKTTLLRILLGKEQADSGTFTIGANTQIGYYEQKQQGFTRDKTLFDEIYDRFPRMDPKDIRNALGLFLFRGDDVFKTMGTLSGGELARMQLLELMLQKRNVLFLDEPTNHLDIVSREQLENALLDYPGTLLIVTHDRYFINRIADRMILLNDNGVSEFFGDWDAYLGEIENGRKSDSITDSEESKMPTNNLYVRQKERKSALNKLRTRMKRLEEDIENSEKILADLEESFTDPSVVSDYVKSAEIAVKIEAERNKNDTMYSELEEIDSEITALEAEDIDGI